MEKDKDAFDYELKIASNEEWLKEYQDWGLEYDEFCNERQGKIVNFPHAVFIRGADIVIELLEMWCKLNISERDNKWASVWYGKIGYDYWFAEFFFKSKKDLENFKKIVPIFNQAVLNMNLTNQVFIERIADLSSDLKIFYNEHIGENNYFYLFVFVGDLNRYTKNLVKSIARNASDNLKSKELDDILKYLEKGMLAEDTFLQSLLATRFLCGLDYGLSVGELKILESKLGPELKRILSLCK